MPAPAKPKSTAKPKKKAAEPTNLPVVYPELAVNIYAAGRKGCEPPMTLATAVHLLGWETESAVRTRMLADNPALKDAEKLIVVGADGRPAVPLLTLDENFGGERVFAWNNANNRPFREGHCRKLAQDILNRKWRLNLENIVIANTGRVHSGQHRLAAFVLACLRWAGPEKDHWITLWPEEPTVECSVAFGVEDTADVRASYDNTAPRTLADTLFTSEVFQTQDNKARLTLCQSLDNAVDTLWQRTKAGEGGEDRYNKYQTHATSQDFLARHPRLLKCVEHLWAENKDRGISGLSISPGWAAAMCYLMGSGTSDLDRYANKGREEKLLKWDRWDAAKDFWAAVAGLPEDDPLRTALADLMDVGDTTGEGRRLERSCLICKAWEAYLVKGDSTWTATDLALPYLLDDVTGEPASPRSLTEITLAGGIDQGTGPAEHPPGEAKLSPAEVRAAKAAEKERLAKEIAASVETAKGTAGTDGLAAELARHKSAYPGRTLLFTPDTPGGRVTAYAEDAAAVAKAGGDKAKKSEVHGLLVTGFPPANLDTVCGKLVATGLKPALATLAGTDVSVVDWVPPHARATGGDTGAAANGSVKEDDGEPATLPYTPPTKVLPKPLNRR